MQNFTKSLVVSAIALLLVSGCSDDIIEEEETSSACAEEFYNTTVASIVSSSCLSCHSSGGQAGSTGLVFTGDQSSDFNTLESYVEVSDSKIVQKGAGELNHGGNVQLTGSARTSMQDLVDYIKGRKTCAVEADVGSVSSNSIALISPEKTLRSASFKLSGRAPTETELQNAGSINTIDSTLDTYMETEAFYQWIRRSFNDFLLTDKYLDQRNIDGFMSGTDFPSRFWWRDEQPVESNDDWLRRQADYALSREPGNLIDHVIRNNRPFSEILTANYVLVNPFSARTYGMQNDDFAFDDNDANLTREEILSKYPLNNLKEVQVSQANGTLIPHAGVLTTMSFMRRFPSTNTNLDRARSAKTQLFFFDTDILGLANRPIEAVDVIGNSATWTNPNCTVCHNVMEPISSTFSNWDNEGRYRVGWRKELAAYTQEPGLSLDKKAPVSASDNLLQWMSKEMVKDDRFAMASVKIFVRAILGRDALRKPASDNLNYTQALQAYNYENAILVAIRNKFTSSGMNAKVIIKEIIKSPLFRASASTSGNTVLSQNLGQAKLITPEALNNKIHSVMGVYYTSNSYYRGAHHYGIYDDDNNSNPATHTLLQSTYRLLYGGMDSDGITTRVSELNGIMANIQLKIALDMSCYPTTKDFYFDRKDRLLFPYVSATQEPLDEYSILGIKKNIQHLHKHILGEELSVTNPEIEATYKIFYDTYMEGNERIINLDESAELFDGCRLYYLPKSDGTPRERLETFEEIRYDKNYVIRSWAAVIAYLVSDFKFFYETTAE